MLKKKMISLTAAVLLAASLSPLCFSSSPVWAKDYERLVVMSDVHYGSKEHKDLAKRARVMANKEKAVQDINSWKDVDLCIFTGDMVELSAGDNEYRLARKFTDKVTQPKTFIAGNHEVVYSETPAVKGKLQPADPYERMEHIGEYKANYGPLYYAKNMGNYLLLFLSPDEIEGHIINNKPYAVELSEAELTWLKAELKANRNKPTLIFCHTPLEGTILPDNSENEPRNFTAPAKEIKDILSQNPQVLVWASGHTHTPPTDASFDNAVNHYAGTSVLDVYNPAWEGDQIWTNSFYLYSDKIVIRTYSHENHQWLTRFDRTISLPASLTASNTKPAA